MNLRKQVEVNVHTLQSTKGRSVQMVQSELARLHRFWQQFVMVIGILWLSSLISFPLLLNLVGSPVVLASEMGKTPYPNPAGQKTLTVKFRETTGRKSRRATITVIDGQGNIVCTTKTDECGMATFIKPEDSEWKMHVKLLNGTNAEFLMLAEDNYGDTFEYEFSTIEEVMERAICVISFPSRIDKYISHWEERGPEIYQNETTTDFLDVVGSKNIAELKQMLNEGVDPNVRNCFGETALMLSRHEEILDTLLDHGADINDRSQFGATPLMYSLCFYCPPTITKKLISAGANLDLVELTGKTALILAVIEEESEKVELLLNAGADVRLLDDEGKSALDYAIQSGNEEIIQMLKPQTR